jgi:hypothetical protein
MFSGWLESKQELSPEVRVPLLRHGAQANQLNPNRIGRRRSVFDNRTAGYQR